MALIKPWANALNELNMQSIRYILTRERKVYRVGHVRAAAQVNQRAVAIGSNGLAVRDLATNNLLLELVVLKHVQRLLLGQHHALERLLLANDAVDVRLQGGVIARTWSMPQTKSTTNNKAV
jgi:hypothetical protein